MIVHRPSVSTLGAYPGDYFYDPNRPSWVPFWYDTANESLRKQAGLNTPDAVFKAPLAAPNIPAPKTAKDMAAWTPEKAFDQYKVDYADWRTKAIPDPVFPSYPNSVDGGSSWNWNPFGSPDSKPLLDPWMKVALAAGAVALVIVLIRR